ncbi:hypothetical protein CY0110_08111 [Crocosphaera chwakensis CCY0110]|uniref:Uncharacterized protein n=1 Tax=Crocosphaera chwakensis CCY0110 TaxID=391612 RepID=A3ISA7_9CHRO|nr:hypothetical protein CY0110_08111 [Crocosphaera chwakensis CCY0110]
MPVIDGDQSTQIIRTKMKELALTKTTNIIALTISSFSEN